MKIFNYGNATISFQKQHCGVMMAAAVQTTLLRMEDLANVTQMPMEIKKDLAVLQKVGAGTLMNTAKVLDPLT